MYLCSYIQRKYRSTIRRESMREESAECFSRSCSRDDNERIPKCGGVNSRLITCSGPGYELRLEGEKDKRNSAEDNSYAYHRWDEQVRVDSVLLTLN